MTIDLELNLSDMNWCKSTIEELEIKLAECQAKKYVLILAAWEVWVKTDQEDWKMFSLYTTPSAADACAKRLEELYEYFETEVRPLYRKEKSSEPNRP